MHILTLAIHFRAQRISAHCVKYPAQVNDGGMLVTVYPGGRFMGFSFAELLELGSGRHEVEEYDKHDFQNTGTSSGQTPDQEQIEQFEEVLFGYQQGAFTSLEVLAAAERVLSALSTNTKSNEREDA